MRLAAYLHLIQLSKTRDWTSGSRPGNGGLKILKIVVAFFGSLCYTLICWRDNRRRQTEYAEVLELADRQD